MLVNEEEIEELGVTDRHDDEPRHSDRKEQQRALDEVQAPPQVPVAREQAIEHHAAPGSTMPMSPLDNTASASAAQAASIQLRCSRTVASARCAMSRLPMPTLIQKLSPVSSVSMCAFRIHQTQPPSAAALYMPSVAPPDAKADVTDEQHAETSRQRRPCRAVQWCTPNAS